MTEKSIESWDDFVELASDIVSEDPLDSRYLYRGHADARWELEPTLLRRLKGDSRSHDEARGLERTSVSNFRQIAKRFASQNIIGPESSEVEWWMYMQQHGAPTRLLDWTLSIYVALYFAVIDHLEEPGEIWFFNRLVLEHHMMQVDEAQGLAEVRECDHDSYFSTEGSRHLEAIAMPFKTGRMVAQQSTFSVCRDVLGHHGQILEEALGNHPNSRVFGKLVVPGDSKMPMLRQLRAMNITAGSLFPGLDGAARSVDERLRVALA